MSVKDWADGALSIVPFIRAYPMWVQVLSAICISLFAILLVALIFVPKESDPSNPNGKITSLTTTGDKIIDDVIMNLHQLPDHPQDADIRESLKPLFNRPAFYASRGRGDWNYFLYAVCRTRLLLETNQNRFDLPANRSAISQAVQRMAILQDLAAQLYGNDFSLSSHIKKYADDSTSFINKLPNLTNTPNDTLIEKVNDNISEMRKNLKKYGFVDSLDSLG